MRVLQVENNHDLAAAIERLVTASASTCDTAPTGRLAVELAMFEDYDLILLAFTLPDISGSELLARLDAAGTGAPVFLRMRHKPVSEAYAEMLQRFLTPAQVVTKAPGDGGEAAAYNRESVRHRILKSGQIVYRNASCVMDCTILNISATGACIQPADAFDEPGNFVLKIAHGPSRRCEVRWRSGGKLGVRFIQ